jgi:uncharacterized protein YecE (DUF72 family)
MGVSSSDERLRFYASQFGLVEVDSTYYGMPKRQNSELWVARTPEGFTFDVKSFSLFTNHPMRPNALPPEIREGIPSQMLEKTNLYLEQLPIEVVDAAWDYFRDALEPLQAAGRLGCVFFQFPRWFFPSSRSLAYIEQVQERMFGFQIAVEFRTPQWLDERHLEGTLAFLRLRQIPLVAVDMPQEHTTSLPPLAEATSGRVAVVRFHGRNHESWDLRGAPPNVRFRWDYADEELREWLPRLERLAAEAEEVHAIMNNNYSNYSVKNARRLEELVQESLGGSATAPSPPLSPS